MNLREVLRKPLRLWDPKARNFPVGFLGVGVDRARACGYNAPMKKSSTKSLVKGILFGGLIVVFAPAIKIALLCAVQALNWIPSIF